MSRVGILTFLHNGNFGSSLQAFALQKTVREMGFVCEHIDYSPDSAEKIRNLIRCGNSPKLLLEGRRKRQVRDTQDGTREKYRRIDEFYSRRMQMSPVCHSRNELARISGQYDILVCGSDQIWNPTWMNPAYFLDFAEPEKRRVAYAASLGVSREPGQRKQRMIRETVSRFAAVSVREEEGAKLMESMTGENPPVMTDPVCLLTKEEWEKTAKPAGRRAPYLLCYFIGENPEYWEKTDCLREETGLEPLVIPVTAEAYAQKKHALLDGAGPEEFLGALAGADLILTDSFHALALGTVFGRRVEVIRRDREGDRESRNSRVDNFRREAESKGLAAMREEGLHWLAQNLS